MGQLVGVVEKPGSTPGVVRFELNRSLSGMGHERFVADQRVVGDTPGALLARDLFATGQVAAVHVYANMVTVDLVAGHTADGLADLIREMYRYWKPGVVPPTFEDLQPDTPAAGDGGGGGDDGGLSEAAKRIPADLLERSRAARIRLLGS